MRLLELSTALGLSLLGAGMIVHASSMPRISHIDYGPGLFPTIVGGAMIGLGLIASTKAILAGSELNAGTLSDDEVPLKRWDLVVVYAAMPLIFVFLTPILGFLLTMPIIIGIPAYLTSRRPLASVLLAVLMSLGLHIVFNELLRVALPWGLLTPWSGVLTWR